MRRCPTLAPTFLALLALAGCAPRAAAPRVRFTWLSNTTWLVEADGIRVFADTLAAVSGTGQAYDGGYAHFGRWAWRSSLPCAIPPRWACYPPMPSCLSMPTESICSHSAAILPSSVW
jgi:hypothetical protein